MEDHINPFGEAPSSPHLSNSPSQPGRNDVYRPSKEVFSTTYSPSSPTAADMSSFEAQDLQFQNFQHTTIDINDGRGRNTIGGAVLNDQTGDFGQQQQETGPVLEQTQSDAHFWNLKYYAKLFNVDTPQVLQRILRSMLPFRFSFMETIRANPDFYGPFWIATTLIFILAVAGNLYRYFETETDFVYDLNLIVVGAAVFYGYVVVIPLVLWGVLKYLKVPVSLLDTMCIYGYSLFIYIPISIICVIPVDVLQWVLVCFACALSGWFLLSNMIVPIKSASHFKKGLLILLVLGALHVGLALTYKLYFFARAYSS